MMEEAQKKPRKKRCGLLWKIPLVLVGVIAVIIVGVLAAVSYVLTPERLTELVEDYGSEYLVDGRVEADRIELFVWSTFPNVEVHIDNLKVANLRSDIPEEHRTVASVERFSGRLDLVELMDGTISIQGIELVRPHATLWEGTDGITSLSILPTAPTEEDKEKTPLELPDIKLSRLAIEGDGHFRYVSLASCIDASVTLKRIAVAGLDELPGYSVQFSGDFGMAEMIKTPLNIGIDGNIGWSPKEPERLELDGFKVNLDKLESTFSAKLNFRDLPEVESLNVEVTHVPLHYLNMALEAMNTASASDKNQLPLFESDAELSVSARLAKPYKVDPENFQFPEMHVDARLSDAPLSVPQFLVQLENLGIEVSADIGKSLEQSRVDIKRVQVKFPAANFVMSGSVSNIGENPKVRGNFSGLVNFSRINSRLWQLLGMKMKGRLNADVDFNLHLQDLTPYTFHQAKLTGSATLNDFMAYLPEDSIAAGLNYAQLSFGSSRKFAAGEVTVDSLLSVSFKTDSAWIEMPELNAQLSGLAMGFGIENRAASGDTSTVTPMGGGIRLTSLRFRNHADSSRAMLRNLAGGFSVRRFNGKDSIPQMGVNLNIGRVFCSNGATRISLSDAGLHVSGHNAPEKQRRRTRTAADSLRMRLRRDSALAATKDFETVDFGAARSSINLLRRWHVTGGVKAARGRYVSPSFPLRTTMSNLDFSFNADSLILKQLDLTTGHTDFALRGLISNIQRAVGRRRGASPLRLNLGLRSDTLNINEITQALFKGAGATEANVSYEDEIDDITADEVLAEADTMPTMAPVVPMNIDAKFTFNAKNVIYSTMLLHDFKGDVLMARGAAQLRGLHASSAELGAVDLNMLYYAPKRTEVSVGLGLDLNRFNIGKVSEVIPALDTIMPMLNTLSGVVDVKITATTPADSMLNVNLPEMKAMLSIKGDSLTLIDPETFKTIGKWLMFKNKNRNLIDHVESQLVLENDTLSLYPFMFDFDRYRLGVMGYNDLDLNLDYHVSVLKSPLPFRFGINVSGPADNMKIRLGKARFKEEMAAESVAISDTVRMNLAREIQEVFTRGTNAARMAPLRLRRPKVLPSVNLQTDTLSASDSLYLRQEGLLETTDTITQYRNK